MRRTLSVLTIALVVIAAGAIAGSAASPKTPPSKQEIAKRILATPAGKALTPTARIALEAIARGDHRATPDSNGLNAPAAVRQAKGAKPGGGPLPNVRVNDPGKDSNQVDQTTQSETSIAVAGSNVAVGYNDSQRTLLVLTAASNLSGVSNSTDGGQTFTDGGTIPNAPGKNNFGDPWLATDSAATMYYSNLVLDIGSFSLLVGVAKSTDGGKSWSQATPIPPPPGNEFGYMADKDAMVAAGTGNLYDTWDDFTTTFDPNTGVFTEFSGLPVAHTTDGGSTWSIAYADKTVLFTFDPNKPPDAQDCSFHQYIGAMPLVAADGTVYEAALKFGVDDPNCTFTAPFTEEEWIFASHDGGQTFPQKVKIADVSPSTGSFLGAFQLGPSQLMRNLELPTLAAKDGNLHAAWNDGATIAPVPVVSSCRTSPRTLNAFGLIETALGQAQIEREQIDCLAVGLGPGSYTGIRAAISIAQAWQLARNVRVLGVGSVECFALQAQADVVIIDTPTMAPGSDAAVVGSISDAALVIAGAPSGQAGELARAVDLLDQIEGLVVGVVLNAVSDDDHDGRVAMLRKDMPRVSLARVTRTVMRPPVGVNLTAFESRFHSTCWRRSGSP